MKKLGPLIITVFVGWYAVADFFVSWSAMSVGMELLLEWALILAAFAYVLGGINVVQVNWPKIRRREADWQYKVLLLASVAAMGLVGIEWHTFGGQPENGTVEIVQNSGQSPGQNPGQNPGQSPGGPDGAADRAVIEVTTTRDDAVIVAAGQRSIESAARFEVAPGKHLVKVYVETAGYGEFTTEVELAAGQVARVRTDLVTRWGKSGRVYTWMYNYIFDPCNSTMFALLAFFIASAAFRAFRARNTEAALLLGAAIVIMLGRAPIGRVMHEWIPEIADWIVDVPNNAGRRAIMMGAALGAVATGLRVILGLERSHLGSSD